MNDFNNFNRPEPVVTVSRPVFSKHTPLYIISLICVAGGSVVYWQYMNKAEVVPVVTEVVDVPLTEAETNKYRDTLPRLSANSESPAVPEDTIVVPDGVKEISPESVAELVAMNSPSETFIVPNNATAVELSTVTSPASSDTQSGASTISPQTAYLEGDVTILDFQLDSQTTSGSAVELTGTVHASDANLKRLAITSNGTVYTVQVDTTKITTQTGKTIVLANLKKDDIVTVSGTKLDDSDVIIAQSVTLTGVQEYNVAI